MNQFEYVGARGNEVLMEDLGLHLSSPEYLPTPPLPAHSWNFSWGMPYRIITFFRFELPSPVTIRM